MEMNALDKLAYTLVVIGGLNWGLIGFFDRELVEDILNLSSGVSRTVYAIIGLAAVYMLVKMFMMMSEKKPSK